MVSRIMFLVFALSFISFGSGYWFKRAPDPFKEVMGCFKIALDNSRKELQKGNIGDAICYYKVRLSIKCAEGRGGEKIDKGNTRLLNTGISLL